MREHALIVAMDFDWLVRQQSSTRCSSKDQLGNYCTQDFALIVAGIDGLFGGSTFFHLTTVFTIYVNPCRVHVCRNVFLVRAIVDDGQSAKNHPAENPLSIAIADKMSSETLFWKGA